MPYNMGWGTEPDADGSAWDGYPSLTDPDVVKALELTLAEAMSHIIRCRLKGLDLWANLSSNKRSGTPLLTVNFKGQPRYAGGASPLAMVGELRDLCDALQRL